jgi:hypothetical protein
MSYPLMFTRTVLFWMTITGKNLELFQIKDMGLRVQSLLMNIIFMLLATSNLTPYIRQANPNPDS